MTMYINEGLTEQEAYFKANKQTFIPQHPDEDMSEKVNDVCKKQDSDGWELLKAIVKLSPKDNELLSFIGAGSFEDWISEDNFKKFEEEIKERISEDSKWLISACPERLTAQ